MVIAGARDTAAPALLDLQKLHPDQLIISEIDVESQRSIIVRHHLLHAQSRCSCS